VDSLFKELKVYDRLLLQYYGENGFPSFLNSLNPALTFRISVDKENVSHSKKMLETILKEFMTHNLIVCTDRIFDSRCILPPDVVFLDFYKVGDKECSVDNYLEKLIGYTYSRNKRLKFSVIKSSGEDFFFNSLIHLKDNEIQNYKVNRNLLQSFKFLNNHIVLLPEDEQYYYFVITLKKVGSEVTITLSDFHLPDFLNLLSKTKRSD
jgi:hypothetical protein